MVRRRGRRRRTEVVAHALGADQRRHPSADAGTATASPGHRFATVRLTVGNPGSTPLRFLRNAAVVDQHGTSHSQNAEASVALGEVNAFVDPIAPGETRDATMTVELPRQAKPVSFEIREDLLADSVIFDLRWRPRSRSTP